MALRPTQREYPYGAVALTGGPLQEQYERIHASYLALDNDRLLEVFGNGRGFPPLDATQVQNERYTTYFNRG